MLTSRLLGAPCKSARALARCSFSNSFSPPVHGDLPPTGVVVPPWATVNPETLNGAAPVTLSNFCDGKWQSCTSEVLEILDPLNGEVILRMPRTQGAELEPFGAAAAACPKTGLHNPFKNKERYVMYGEIFHQAAVELSSPEVMDFMAKCIMRVMPKSYFQAWYEVKVTADFLKNFAGDNVRFNAGGQHVPGDHLGQESKSYRFPFGPVAIIAPFNFPLEIPVLQLMGALMMGNRPTLKPAEQTSLIMEQYLRLLLHCGVPPGDMDLLHCEGPAMGELIGRGHFRLTQFTGSSEVAELLAKQTHGKIRVEDAGFDWKVLGPDVGDEEYVAWVCDQDAYAASGQKCSAQSILFMHENWRQARGGVDFEARLRELAARRRLENLTVGPVMSLTTAEILAHTERVASIPGAYVAWGGRELQGHTTPACYGMVEPTAVFVPLDEMLKDEYFDVVTKEIFGPFQILTSYDDASLDKVLAALERMSHHLTAAVVSNDPRFQDRVLGATVNGTQYVGRRARTTGAPQNHCKTRYIISHL